MKGNPFNSMNPMQQIMNLAKQAKQMQNDPTMISKMLYDNGRINKETYEQIKGMNSPSQIGNYLMENGILMQQQAQQYANYVPQIQQMMR